MKSRKILVTGATGGLGTELSLQLARSGADLLLLGRSMRLLDALSSRITSEKLAEPGVCAVDFTKFDSNTCEQVQMIVEEQYGGLDILIHAAGFFEGLQPFEHISDDGWKKSFDVNTRAPWLLTQACLPFLLRSACPSIVFVTEDAKLCRSAYRAAYGSSKAALDTLVSTLQEELGERGVRVAGFCPPPMRTELRAMAYLSEDPELLADPFDVAADLIKSLGI